MSKLRMVFVGFLFVLMIYSIVAPWRTIPASVYSHHGLPLTQYDTTDYGLPFIWGTRNLTTTRTTLENGEAEIAWILVYGINRSVEYEEGMATEVTIPINATALRLHLVSVEETWRVNPTYLLFDILFWNGLIAIVAVFRTEKPNFRIPRIRITVDRPDQSIDQ